MAEIKLKAAYLIAGAAVLIAAAPAEEELPWVPNLSEVHDGARLLNLNELVTADDYPAQAQLADEQGTVGVLVKVDASGRVADCAVEFSSGSAALDAQTCRLFWLRAKFEPHRDPSGKAVASVFRRKITWRLEGEGMPLDAWAHTLFVSFPPGGRPLCRVAMEGALQVRIRKELPEYENAGCKEVFGELSWLDAVPTGREPKTGLAIEQRFVPHEQLSLGAAPKIPGELMYRVVLHLKIDEGGKVVECREAGTEGDGPPLSNACRSFPSVFSPPAAKDGKPASMTATMILSSYVQPR